jgi:hypothetical protein
VAVDASETEVSGKDGHAPSRSGKNAVEVVKLAFHL